jgi:DNA end-binding protein Ku
MAAHRAQWKGFIKFAEVSCAGGPYTPASTSERITFNTINKATGHRVNRVFIDSETEEPVRKEAQTKGFEIENGRYIVIDPEEVAATIPETNKTLEIEAFIPCSDADDVYFDKPYCLTPSDRTGSGAFTALRDGMRKAKVAAIARAVLFRRMRTVLIRLHGNGLIATTLNYDYEVRSTPTMVSDPIQDALLALIAEKKRALKPAKKSAKGKEATAPASNLVNIMDALRKSVANELKSRKAG